MVMGGVFRHTLGNVGFMTAESDWDHLVGKAETVRHAFESVPTMLCAFEGPRHVFAAANAAYRGLYPKATGLGRSAVEISPEVDGQRLQGVLDHVYQTGEAIRVPELRTQLDFDGSGIQERYFDVVVAPWRRPDGTVGGVLNVVSDITEQVLARTAAEARANDLTDRYLRVRESAMVMQKALLAAAIPVLPGADIAAEYVVAAEETAAGGDWFDAVPCRDGTVALVVGDVVGHGVEAAAVMAQLRAATRLHLLAGRGVADTLSAVEGFAAHVTGARSATVCIGRLNTGTGEFEYCTAGHPPPLVVGGRAAPRYLAPSGAGPLCSGTGFPVLTETIDVGQAVLLYTDGVIERPGRPLSASTAELAEVAASVLAGVAFPLDDGLKPIDRLCSQTLELLLRRTGYSDDVTLLAAQRRLPPAPLHFSLPADRHAVGMARDRVRGWLSDVGADASDILMVEHAVCEYVDNAAQHAYDTTAGGEVIVEAALGDDGCVFVSVTDHGQWKERADPSANRGRGLSMADALVSQTTVRGSDKGTRAEIVHRLSRPARIVTDPRVTHVTRPSPAEAHSFDVALDADGHLVVRGEVDSLSAPALAGYITVETQAGTRPAHIDLTGVTHLGSAGVSVLAEARERALNHHTAFTLVAPPGCPAHHVLTLVNLPMAGGNSENDGGLLD
jgi:anti-anti-sigma factor